MPKAYLAYDLDEPNDREHYKYASTALDVRLAVKDFDDYLRTIIKYGEDHQQEIGVGEARILLADYFEARGVYWEVI